MFVFCPLHVQDALTKWHNVISHVNFPVVLFSGVTNKFPRSHTTEESSTICHHNRIRFGVRFYDPEFFVFLRRTHVCSHEYNLFACTEQQTADNVAFQSLPWITVITAACLACQRNVCQTTFQFFFVSESEPKVFINCTHEILRDHLRKLIGSIDENCSTRQFVSLQALHYGIHDILTLPVEQPYVAGVWTTKCSPNLPQLVFRNYKPQQNTRDVLWKYLRTALVLSVQGSLFLHFSVGSEHSPGVGVGSLLEERSRGRHVHSRLGWTLHLQSWRPRSSENTSNVHTTALSVSSCSAVQKQVFRTDHRESNLFSQPPMLICTATALFWRHVSGVWKSCCTVKSFLSLWVRATQHP